MKLLRSFAFAFNGWKICFSSEINFRIHMLFTIAALLLSITLKITSAEWLAIIFCIAFVAAMEMTNTAIEKLCDVVQPGIHLAIKKVKDIAAGAVLLAAVCSVVIGSIIFLPKIIILMKSFYK
ncbi:diacylglycerol kinase family protein [Ferruginibacter sp.]|nr:diacylglycerol kinase family protein [Ferruginibacter sp.]